jgi:hypothetical protein
MFYRSGHLTNESSFVIWRPNPYHEFCVSGSYARDYGFEIKFLLSQRRFSQVKSKE